VPYGADRSEIAAALKDCDHAAGEHAVQICAWDKYRREDLKYREAAKQAAQSLAEDSVDRTLLAQANRAFEQFRKATCAFDSNAAGGMAGSLLYGCLERYTRRRAHALEVYAQCQKTGDCALPNLLYMDENENESHAH
jgi:uncharacterized protein YecT (DUF1311 family)